MIRVYGGTADIVTMRAGKTAWIVLRRSIAAP